MIKKVVMFLMFLCSAISVCMDIDFTIGIEDNNDGPDEFDDIDVTDDFLTSLRDKEITPEDVLNMIACPPISIQNRLQENLYLRTQPLQIRSLLDEPQFLLHLGCLPPDWQFNLWYFYNQTSKANVTANSTKIRTYLGINTTNFFANLEELLQDLGINIDLPTLQELLGRAKVQERRAGFMFDIFKQHNDWNFEIKWPLYFFERNFFVTDQERRRFEQLLQREMNVASMTKIATFDQVGFGDTRFAVGYVAADTEWLGVNVGAQVTIPTAFSFAKGMIGTNFPENSQVPPFDILGLAREAICDEDIKKVIEQVLDFAFGVYERLAATLLKAPIGNNGHVGFGGFIEKHMPLNQRFMFKSRIALEYLFPSSETRSFITKKAGLFDQQFCFEGVEIPEQLAVEKLDFLNEQLILTLVPRFVKVSVWPGFIFKMQTSIMGNFGKDWEMGVGLDTWWQSEERLRSIKASPILQSQLRVDLARRPMAYQNKFFGVVNYYHQGLTRLWCWTLYGDYTFLSTGIGRDFNLSLHMAFDY